jgi:hypothetical protein
VPALASCRCPSALPLQSRPGGLPCSVAPQTRPDALSESLPWSLARYPGAVLLQLCTGAELRRLTLMPYLAACPAALFRYHFVHYHVPSFVILMWVHRASLLHLLQACASRWSAEIVAHQIILPSTTAVLLCPARRAVSVSISLQRRSSQHR